MASDGLAMSPHSHSQMFPYLTYLYPPLHRISLRANPCFGPGFLARAHFSGAEHAKHPTYFRSRIHQNQLGAGPPTLLSPAYTSQESNMTCIRPVSAASRIFSRTTTLAFAAFCFATGAAAQTSTQPPVVTPGFTLTVFAQGNGTG